MLACFSALTLAALAQTTPEAAPSAAAPAPAAVTPSTAATAAPPPPVATTSDSTVSTSPRPAETSTAATPPPSAPTATAPTTPPAPAAAPAKESLRRLDTPAPAPLAQEPPADADKPHHFHVRSDNNDRVAVFNNASLAANEFANSVVAVCGNATSEGEVGNAVVAVCGNASATGPVRDAVVAVLGNVYVDAPVSQVVAVLGNVDLGPNADVKNDVVCIGGVVHRDPKAIVHGDVPNVGLGPVGVPRLEWLHSYIQNCVIKFRPLAIAPHLGFAWALALGFLGLYVLLALLFRGGVERCVQVLETRPGGTLVAALIAMVLMPVLFALSVVTIAGIVVLPCAFLFGKTVMLAWLGRRITRHLSQGALNHVAFATLVGGIIVLGLYLVPLLGFVVQNLLGIVGLGVVVYSLLLAARRDKPVPAPAAAAPMAAAPVYAGAATIPPMASATPAAATVAPESAAAAVPPIVAAALPRAGFWIRTGALFIDVILGAIIFGIAGDMMPRFLHVHGPSPFMLTLAIYGAILWKLKGSTIGGIVCGLRVVRLDNRPIDWATAIVRALSCFLSLMVAGLGFIWVAIDDEKQSWHDKIAGTTVVHARGSVTLV